MNKTLLSKEYQISGSVVDFVSKVEEEVLPEFKKIDEVAEYNQYKVLSAFKKNKVSEMHFNGTTGYGYNDAGREVIEKVYKDVFHTEDSLVRINMVSGTHALKTALFGNLKPGDTFFSPTGEPYDTILDTIKALEEHGIAYKQVDWIENREIDFDGIRKCITGKTKLAHIQRSRGYSTRDSLPIETIRKIIRVIKEVKDDVICMVDNCYGEFVETLEPTDVGADMVVGSLIKNMGGGLAPIGGYIAGKREYVEAASFHLTAPGLGKEIGASLGLNRSFLQGLFLAPTVVANSLKGMILFARAFEKLGYEVSPGAFSERTDIVQQIHLKDENNIIEFCKAIQASSPVDSHAAPEPWNMPGYDSKVIMAAGTFIQGSSIELSADAPIREPYTVYLQGGLTYPHVKLALLNVLQKSFFKNLVI